MREVLTPEQLVQRLEALRLVELRDVIDCNIYYKPDCSINGGSWWSSSFINATKHVLGWSNGAHGLRHTYVQERMIDHHVNHGWVGERTCLRKGKPIDGIFQARYCRELFALKMCMVFPKNRIFPMYRRYH